MTVRLVNDSTALLSMRESDFDATSAYGEVIDNAIEAKATDVRIHFEYEPDTKQEAIKWVAYGDDGTGMDANTLHQCLQLGYSSRYNSRSGIGRFGVGATLAAINQCQRVDIYSKMPGQKWNYTYIDIEEIAKDPDKGSAIPGPVEQPPADHLLSLTSNDHGTVVVWRKYDRQPNKASRVMEDAKEWIGRTYRYFIWDGVRIYLNSEQIPAVDPLYARTEKTRFEGDPKATLYTVDRITWPVPELDRQSDSPTESVIEIQMSLLPDDFRSTQGSGNTAENRRRYVDHNEGISILRNRREVFYGPIPYWPGTPPFQEIDRWWGCEIRFNAVLDRAFTVKNIKQGAVPERELKRTLADRIQPTRKSCLEKVRDLWAANKKKDKAQATDKDTLTGHEAAERTAKETKTPTNLIDRGKDSEKEVNSFVEKWQKDAEEVQKAAWKEKFQGQPFTIVEDEWPGPHFFESYHMGGSSVLSYNSRHTYFEELEGIASILSDEAGNNEPAVRLRTLLDILMMSYAKAEAMFDSELTLKAEDFSEQLRSAWGSYLKGYIKTWRTDREESG